MASEQTGNVLSGDVRCFATSTAWRDREIDSIARSSGQTIPTEDEISDREKIKIERAFADTGRGSEARGLDFIITALAAGRSGIRTHSSSARKREADEQKPGDPRRSKFVHSIRYLGPRGRRHWRRLHAARQRTERFWMARVFVFCIWKTSTAISSRRLRR